MFKRCMVSFFTSIFGSSATANVVPPNTVKKNNDVHPSVTDSNVCASIESKNDCVASAELVAAVETVAAVEAPVEADSPFIFVEPTVNSVLEFPVNVVQPAEPVMQPMQLVMQPVAEPVVESVVQLVVKPVTDSIVQLIMQPVAEPVVEYVVQPVAALAPEPVVESVAALAPESVAALAPEPVVESVAALAPEPVAALAPEPVAKPVVESVELVETVQLSESYKERIIETPAGTIAYVADSDMQPVTEYIVHYETKTVNNPPSTEESLTYSVEEVLPEPKENEKTDFFAY